MEECEALCSRICILVNGSLQCIGSIPTLKTKFASGYQVDVKVNADCIKSYREWLQRTFPDAKILEDQHENMTHQVAHTDGFNMSLGKIFRTFEQNKDEQGITEYSVT